MAESITREPREVFQAATKEIWRIAAGIEAGELNTDDDFEEIVVRLLNSLAELKQIEEALCGRLSS